MGMNTAKPAPTTSAPASTPGSTAIQPSAPGVINAEPAWALGTPISMLLYTSTSPTGSDLDLASPLVAWDNLTYGGWKDEREVDLLLDVPRSVRMSNGSWWMDVMLVKGGGTSLAAKGQGEVAMYRKRASKEPFPGIT